MFWHVPGLFHKWCSAIVSLLEAAENLCSDALMLCWQIHERLRRFEKRGLLPVREHAAGLASDVSIPVGGRGIRFTAPAASSDKETSSSRQSAAPEQRAFFPTLGNLRSSDVWQQWGHRGQPAWTEMLLESLSARQPELQHLFISSAVPPVALQTTCPCASSWRSAGTAASFI